MKINLSSKQRDDISQILSNYSRPTPEEYLKTSGLLGKDVVKAVSIKGLEKLPQDGWKHPLYRIVDPEFELPVGYALHFLGHGQVSLHDAAVHLYREIYNETLEAKNFIQENFNGR